MLRGLIIVNGVVFLLGLLLIIFLVPKTKLDLLSWLVYDLIVSFTVSLEVPGWLKLSKLDESRSETITKLRTTLIKIRYLFDPSFEELKKIVKAEKIVLEEEEIGDIINDFVNACEDANEPLNESLWALTLSETTERINAINKRSKHPIPKLIDILALSGLSVLIAELLKLIG
jgi:hypothetical protein